MNDKEFEQVMEAVDLALQDGGITVHVSKRSVLTLFGCVIGANIATVFVLQGLTRGLKDLAKWLKEEEKEVTDEFTEFVKSKTENVHEADTED